MKLPNFANAKKEGAKMYERVKNTLCSQWVSFKPMFRKHGDKLLFALALAVLAVSIFRLDKRISIPGKELPVMVFTQWWQDDIGRENLQSIANEFESRHGNIKIKLIHKTHEEIKSELYKSGTISGSAADDNPGDFDIIALDPLWVPELLAAQTVEEAFQKENDEIPGSKNFQILSFINVLFYNINLLKEANFSRPPKTRGEFISYARAVNSNNNGRRGLAMGLAGSRGIYDDIYPWIWSAGVQLTRNGNPAVNTRQVIEALNFLSSLMNEDLIVPGIFSADSEKKLQDFTSGRAAFMIASADTIERVINAMGSNAFGITTIPSSDTSAGNYYYASAGWTLGINPASERKEEAMQFADFLAEKAFFLSESSRAMPANGVPPSIDDPFYPKILDMAISGEQAQDFLDLPWNSLDTIFREELSYLFSKEQTPAETAAVIQKKWEEVLERPH